MGQLRRSELFDRVRSAAAELIREIDPPPTPPSDPKGAAGWAAVYLGANPPQEMVEIVEVFARKKEMTTVEVAILLERAWEVHEGMVSSVHVM